MGSWKQYRKAYGLPRTTVSFTRHIVKIVIPYWTSNLVKDLHARRVGLCNEVCWPDHGGYEHWRCLERRHHESPHRFHNYSWTDDTQVKYDPVDVVHDAISHSGQVRRNKQNDREMFPTIRQARAWRKKVRRGSGQPKFPHTAA